MRIGVVQVRVEDADNPRVIEGDDENPMPLVAVGDLMFGFESEAAIRKLIDGLERAVGSIIRPGQPS